MKNQARKPLYLKLSNCDEIHEDLNSMFNTAEETLS